MVSLLHIAGQEPATFNFDTYWIRSFVVLWFFIFPSIFLCFFLLLKNFKSKKSGVLVTHKLFYDFRHYGYFFHNLLFIFFVSSFLFNSFFFVFSFIDTYILEIDYAYQVLWKMPNPTESAKKINFFWSIVFCGCLLHFTAFIFYIYYNLYHSSSWFGEKYRAFIINLAINKYVLSLKSKFPRLYKYIHRYFLDVSHVQKEEKISKVIIIG
ncbi:hypothetical protein HF1_01170 [Mycoplasma haemofelis str. Langford 1]|uniref:Uncharacterized protein n=1 Tax=Mycoplasma haemofelis (strain Langford 1) TaxID=941640 RepID=E8ZKF9_MYCHL|nr:hypothetical protein [Mycoplasma haemofelis]CBY92125.1 hypothetical protein HF1_01170 [Mycoplasma haemofelis str. Langford 1]